MKKLSQTSDHPPNLASAVLRATIAAADRLGHLHRQHFVIRETVSSAAEIMKPAKIPAEEKPAPEQDAGNSTLPWEDSSGEGAASALESLRKIEQSRSNTQPADDRPAAE